MAEALACGTPVVAPRAGGALDIVSDGVPGRFVADGTPCGFAAALRDLPDDRGRVPSPRARFAEERFIRPAGRSARRLRAGGLDRLHRPVQR